MSSLLQCQLHRLALPTQPLGARGTFVPENRAWCRCSDLPCPPAGPHPVSAVPCLPELPAPLGRRSNSAAGSDLSIILYPHAFNFYSPVGAIPRAVNNTAPPPFPARIHHASTKVGLGGGQESTGKGMPLWWHPVLCPHPSASPTNLGTPPRSVLGLGAPAPCW